MTADEETAIVQQLASQIQASLPSAENTARILAALELVITREMLKAASESEFEADAIRAAASELFETASAAELEELAARDLGPWASQPWDDVPIPFAVAPTTETE